MTLPDVVEGPVLDWVIEQRWFASKSRDVAELNVFEHIALGPGLDLEIVEARFAEGDHALYQLLRGTPGGMDVLAQLMRDGGEVGCVRFDGDGRPNGAVRPLGAEQSNTSMVIGDRDVLKVFRRLEAGENPELEMVRYLSARGYPNIAELTGSYSFSGDLFDATLGVMQAYVPEGRDGWDLALDDPEGVLGRLGELGVAVAQLHTVLGSEAVDPDFAPEEPSVEAMSLLVATIDEEIERTFRDLPEIPALQEIAGRSGEMRDRLSYVSNIGVPGRIARFHGDFHLGQTLLTDERWIILDFEGEPARPLLERRRKGSVLRDVAGILRSFAYAAAARELLRGQPPIDGWETRAREAFLETYLDTVESSLLPAGRDAVQRLLAIFELDKALYELRYELDNRPDWVPIPVRGIVRLLEEELTV